MIIRAGFLDSFSGVLHAIGPFLYMERGGFMLHVFARRFFQEPYRGSRWRIALRIRGRYIVHVGRG